MVFLLGYSNLLMINKDKEENQRKVMLTFFKRPTWPLRPNRVYVFERTTTPNK